MLEFNVNKISCGHCAGAVTRAIKAVDPDAKVEVVIPEKRVKVETTETRDAIVAALAEIGYPAN